jgi:hypothetical protein
MPGSGSIENSGADQILGGSYKILSERAFIRDYGGWKIFRATTFSSHFHHNPYKSEARALFVTIVANNEMNINGQ